MTMISKDDPSQRPIEDLGRLEKRVDELRGKSYDQIIYDEIDRQTKWDLRFIKMAELVASWSKDPSTKCGAIIVRPDRSVASVGFNGFPRGVEDRQEHLDEREEKYGRVIHAEVNAILAAREPLHGYTMYTFPAGPGPSCDRCATCIIQAGIARIVHIRKEPEPGDFNNRWFIPVERGLDMYRMAGMEVVDLPNYLPTD